MVRQSKKRPTAETVSFKVLIDTHWHKGKLCDVGDVISIAKWKVKGFEKQGVGKLVK